MTIEYLKGTNLPTKVDQVSAKVNEIIDALGALTTTVAGLSLSATPGAAILRGPYSFTYQTAGLNNGVSFYTPTISDLLLAAWIDVTTEWNTEIGLSNADVGQFTGGETTGLWKQATNNFFDLTNDPFVNSGIRIFSSGLSEFGIGYVFTTADPLKLVCSQDGLKGGTAISGATQGAGRVYIITSTPTAFS